MAADRRRKPSKPLPKSQPQPEEIEELETLEPLEEDDDSASPVKVTVAGADEPAFDTIVEVVVPEMEKKAMPAAVAGPLRAALGRAAASVRYRKVLVRFAGDTIIGSAVRDTVGEALREAKALHGVVRRGFGDENVAATELPRAQLTTRAEGGTTVIELANPLDAADLEVAFLPELAKLAPATKGKALRLELGALALPASLRDQLAKSLASAGATRAALGTELLFDKELEALVKLARGKDGTVLAIHAAEVDKLRAAATLALRGQDLAGQRCRLEIAGSLAPAALEALVDQLAAAKVASVELARGSDAAEILWPRLLEAKLAEGKALLAVREGGRARPALLAAFVREVAVLGAKLEGAQVTVDWPAGFDLDADAEKRCITDALAKVRPAAVACTFAGNDREPFLPVPLAIGPGKAGGKLVRLDTDAGKPAELVRALERRLKRAGSELRGQSVVVEIAGSVAPSRTLLKSLLAAVEAAGVSRLAIDDHGKVDVLMPPLLQITKGPAALKLVVDEKGRDAAQLETALQRELDAAELALGENFEIEATPLADTVVGALVARGAESVVLLGKDPVLVHPPLFAAPVRDGEDVEVRAEPGPNADRIPAQLRRELPKLVAGLGDLATSSVTVVWPGAEDAEAEPVAAVIGAFVGAKAKRVLLSAGDGSSEQVHPEVVRTYVSLLGQRDASTPPMAMLGIEVGQGKKHVAGVVERLGTHADLLEGRRVLLVLRDGERDVAARGDTDLLRAVRAVVEAKAAATLLYRGTDDRERPYFEVVHSSLETIAVGARFGDPRPRA